MDQKTIYKIVRNFIRFFLVKNDNNKNKKANC